MEIEGKKHEVEAALKAETKRKSDAKITLDKALSAEFHQHEAKKAEEEENKRRKEEEDAEKARKKADEDAENERKEEEKRLKKE